MLRLFVTLYWFGCAATAKWEWRALHKSEGGLRGLLDDCRLFGFFLISILDNESIRRRPQKTEDVVEGTC